MHIHVCSMNARIYDLNMRIPGGAIEYWGMYILNWIRDWDYMYFKIGNLFVILFLKSDLFAFLTLTLKQKNQTLQVSVWISNNQKQIFLLMRLFIDNKWHFLVLIWMAAWRKEGVRGGINFLTYSHRKRLQWTTEKCISIIQTVVTYFHMMVIIFYLVHD